MGPENSGKFVVYMLTDDGPVEISDKIAAVSVSSGDKFTEIKNLPLENGEITVRVKCAKCTRCGSRKRFVKLLMSRGINRNTAQRIARTVRATNAWAVPEEYRESYQSFFVELFWSGILDWLGGKRNGKKA